jgi:hypothetical protein
MAELDGDRVAAMLAADTKFNVGSGSFTKVTSHLNQLANADLVQFSKWVLVIDFVLIVIFQEVAGIISGETKGHLGQVIGSEGEEFSFGSYHIGQ